MTWTDIALKVVDALLSIIVMLLMLALGAGLVSAITAAVVAGALK